MVTLPVPKTMALGGVPTGSMKAQVAASVAGISSSIGSAPIPSATPPRIGMKVAAVAVFDVISVSRITIAVTAITSQIVGSAPSPDTCWPNHWSRPLADTAEARLSPPPNSISTPQGSPASASFHSSTIRALPCPGRMNSSTPAAMATPVSSKPASHGNAALTAGIDFSTPGTIQKNAAPMNTASTMRSPWLSGPSARIWSSIISRPPGMSGRSKR